MPTHVDVIPRDVLQADGSVTILIVAAGAVPATAIRWNGFAYDPTTKKLYCVAA